MVFQAVELRIAAVAPAEFNRQAAEGAVGECLCHGQGHQLRLLSHVGRAGLRHRRDGLQGRKQRLQVVAGHYPAIPGKFRIKYGMNLHDSTSTTRTAPFSRFDYTTPCRICKPRPIRPPGKNSENLIKGD